MANESTTLIGSGGAATPATAPRSADAAGGGGTVFSCLVATSASIAGLCFGYEIGIVSEVLVFPSFQLFFLTGQLEDGAVVPTADESAINGNIVSSFLVGCIIGSLCVYFLADGVGRRGSIFIGAALFVVGGALQAAAAVLSMFYVGRIVGGAGIGILSMVAPLYISETAETASRGRLIATQQLLITCGILLASCVNALLYQLGGSLGDWQWRSALAAQVIPGIALALIMLPLPESPRWLVSRGAAAQARAVLARLRGLPGDSPAVESELAGIRAEVLAELAATAAAARDGAAKVSPPASQPLVAGDFTPPPPLTLSDHWRRLRELGNDDCRPQLLLVCWLQFWQQMTGINVILYFAANLFEAAGAPPDAAATWFVIANAAFLVLGTLPGMALVDRPGIGRRMLLLVGAAAMALSLAAVAGLIVAGQRGAPVAVSYCAVAAIWGFTVFFSASWGPVVWVLQSEVLPLRNRAQGSAVGTLFNWTTNAIIGKLAPLLIDAGGGYSYLLFGACCVLMGGYVWVWVPETAGVSLEDMSALFRRGQPAAAPTALLARADAEVDTSTLNPVGDGLLEKVRPRGDSEGTGRDGVDAVVSAGR